MPFVLFCGKASLHCSTAEHIFLGDLFVCAHLHRGTVIAQGTVPDKSKLMKESIESMMKKISVAAIVCAFAMFLVAPLAHATTITEVQAMITSLKTKTETVAISGKSADKERVGLLAKLNEASLKVDQAKFCDAIAKLNDFKVSVNHLITVGRINQDPALGTTGQELLNDADATIAALNELQVQSTGAACTF